MSTAIFLRSYRGDREWLRYALKSLEKRARGFEEIVVCLPVGDELHFDKFPWGSVRVEWWQPRTAEPYLDQQANKCYADLYTKCDHILFTDSDAVATADFSPADFGGDRPIQLLRTWDSVGDASCWLEPTARCLGFPPPYETMAALPLMYHRQTLSGFREHVKNTHGIELDEYIRRVPGKTWSEYNCLGSWSLHSLPWAYHWRLADAGRDGFPRTIKQFWSLDGVDKHREELEVLTR